MKNEKNALSIDLFALYLQREKSMIKKIKRIMSNVDLTINKRIGNLSISVATYLCETPERPSYHINMWYPNSYYGREDEFVYHENGEYYTKKDDTFGCVRISKGCFSHPETSFAIASFDADKEGYYELKYVGSRPIEYLKTEEETRNFNELVKYGNEKLNGKSYEQFTTTVYAEADISFRYCSEVVVPELYTDEDIKESIKSKLVGENIHDVKVEIIE